MDQVDAKETKPFQAVEKITFEDASNLLMHRYRQEDDKIKKGNSSPNRIQQRDDFQRAARWIDTFATENPGADIRSAYNSVLVVDASSLPGSRRLQIEAARRELGDLVMRIKGDLNKLSREEKEFILERRNENVYGSEVSEQDQEKLIKEVLAESIFQVSFSSAVVDENGQAVGANGFRTFSSEKGLSWSWERKNHSIFETLMPESSTLTSSWPQEAKEFYNENDIVDGITIRAQFRPVKREVVSTEEKEVVGMWGRKRTEIQTNTHTEFSHNEPLMFPGTNELMVRFNYQTLTREAGGKGKMYTDDNTRPGNVLFVDMLLPLSAARKLVQAADVNPAFIRQFVTAAVFDKDHGIERTINRQSEFQNSSALGLHLEDNTERRNLTPTLRNDRGIPPFNDEDWKKAKMLMDINLEVPRLEQVRGKQALLNRSQIAKWEVAHMRKLIVEPK